jgi:DNA-directed RNA polymerase subunit RPC12/RpoP
MAFLSRLYECTMCGAVRTWTGDTEEDITCPECGSKYFNAINDIKEELKFKAKPHGKTGRPELEITIKDELYKDTNELRQIKMIVDRGHNDWEKTVIDKNSGKERYHKKEPLFSHINRGSTKKFIKES